jgi:hypothetical protein
MYLRFVTDEVDLRTGKAKGMFSLAYELIRESVLSYDDEGLLKQSLNWVESNIPIPTKFSRTNNEYRKNTGGLCWLKSESREAVSKHWDVKNVLEIAGYSVKLIKTNNPGKMVYEDDFQAVALPFSSQKF